MTEDKKQLTDESNETEVENPLSSDGVNEQKVNDEFPESSEISVKIPTGLVISLPPVPLTDPVGALKQTLTEFQETCYFTNYSFSLIDPNDKNEELKVLNDFVEIGTYVFTSSALFYMVLNDYDVKEARNNIKRLREVVNNPPTSRISNLPPYKEDNDLTSKKTVVKDIPNDFVEISSKFSDYFNEVLLRNGTAELPNKHKKAVTSSIKSILLSSWNPPPPNRKLQGDLCYVEVNTTSDGTFFITASTSGFYVNNSTKTVFDPKPSNSHNQHSHEIFCLLLSLSNSFRTSWNLLIDSTIDSINKHVNKDMNSTKALDAIATLFSEGRINQTIVSPVWALTDKESNHSSDYNRLIDDLTNNFGVEEKGATREWNDEIQAFKDLNVDHIQDRLHKARFTHKIITEFTEAAKQLALAIFDGHISPLNYSDVKENYVYYYNGIFVSKAVDTKETFKICEGDEANRKAAGLDLLNQKLLSSLEIEKLSSILTCLIDFKGERLVAQTMIPGILSPGLNAARLLYGALEPNQRIRIKEEGMNIMKQIGSKLFLSERHVLASPNLQSQNISKIEETKPTSNSNSILSRIDSEKATPVKIDDEDEIVSLDELYIPHIGPIESKLLKGSDGRIYALDMLRLTPRDANFVKGPKGTGNIDPILLDNVDDNVSLVYVLRHELINAFIQYKVTLLRQSVLVEAANEYASNKAIDKKDETENQQTIENKELITNSEDNHIEDEENSADKSNNIEIISKDEKSINKFNETDLSDFRISQEVADKYNSLGANDINISINPNVFIPNIDIDKDLDIIIKDEEITREISNYLFKTVLPVLIYQIRINEITPIDNQSFVELLHENGINIRYLGILGDLVKKEEDEDLANKLVGKQRIHSMPPYILEIIEIEIISRAIKHNFSFLTLRINKIALLRRICLLNGICINTKDYDFNQNNPILSNDILNIVPIIKSSEPDVLSKDIYEIITSSKAMYASGTNISTAFELAQEASILVQQIAGPTHKDVLLAHDLMCNILINGNDYNTALNIAIKSLNISIQLYGFDHHSTIQRHIQVGIIYSELQYFNHAINHFHTVLYLLSIVSNPLHPEVSTVLTYLGNLHKLVSNNLLSLRYYYEAKKSIFNLHKLGKLLEIIAETLVDSGNLDEGLKEQRSSHKLFSDILGPDNQLTKESKDRVEKYRRLYYTRNVNLAKQSNNFNNSKTLTSGNEKNQSKDKKK